MPTIEDLLTRIRADASQAQAEMRRAAQTQKSEVDKMDARARASAATQESVAARIKASWMQAAAAAAAVYQGMKYIEAAANVRGLMGAFEGLAQQAGLSSRALLDHVRAASAGTVATEKLLTVTNKLLVMRLSESDILKFFELARRGAQVTGKSVDELVNTLAQAAASGRTASLASQLGLVIDTNEALGRYASACGKVVTQLSEIEKKQALLNETLRVAQERWGNVAVAANDTGERLGRFKALMSDLGVLVGEVLWIVVDLVGVIKNNLEIAFEVLGMLVNMVFGGLLKIFADTANWVKNKILDPLINQARAFAGLLPDALSGPLNKIIDAYDNGINKIIEGANSIGDESLQLAFDINPIANDVGDLIGLLKDLGDGFKNIYSLSRGVAAGQGNVKALADRGGAGAPGAPGGKPTPEEPTLITDAVPPREWGGFGDNLPELKPFNEKSPFEEAYSQMAPMSNAVQNLINDGESGAAAMHMLADSVLTVGNAMEGAQALSTGLAGGLAYMARTGQWSAKVFGGVMAENLGQVLQKLGQESTTRAIYELAMGFSTMFTNPAESAAHFTSAALFGALGAAASIGGGALTGAGERARGASTTSTGPESTPPGQGPTSGYSSAGDESTRLQRLILMELRRGNEKSNTFRLEQDPELDAYRAYNIDSRGFETAESLEGF